MALPLLLMFIQLWESPNIRTQCQKCRTFVTLKTPEHLASRTEFCETLGHDPIKLMYPERVVSLSMLWLCF